MNVSTLDMNVSPTKLALKPIVVGLSTKFIDDVV